MRYSISDKIWNILSEPISSIRSRQYEQKFKTYGKLNPDITFFVIRRRPPAWGFFSNLMFVLQGIIYSDEHGYVPIVDMENYWVSELSSSKKVNGTFNAWCYFFNQVSNYSLNDVYRSKNVILSNGSRILNSEHWFSDRRLLFSANTEKLKYISKIIQKYISLNRPTSNYVGDIKRELKWQPNETLGIFIRGTNYVSFKGPQAPVPDLALMISEIKTALKTKFIKKLFISTEDYRIYLSLRDEFSHEIEVQSIRHNKLVSIEEWENANKQTKENGILMGHKLTEKYLAEIFLLSECPNFISTLSNASLFVLSKNIDNFKYCRLVLSNKIITLVK